jgi:hypothetical protein
VNDDDNGRTLGWTQEKSFFSRDDQAGNRRREAGSALTSRLRLFNATGDFGSKCFACEKCSSTESVNEAF